MLLCYWAEGRLEINRNASKALHISGEIGVRTFGTGWQFGQQTILVTRVGRLGNTPFEDTRMTHCGKAWQWREGNCSGNFAGGYLVLFLLASYLLKVTNVSYFTYLGPPMVVTPLQLHQNFWHQKSRASGRDNMFIHFDTTLACVRQTERWMNIGP